MGRQAFPPAEVELELPCGTFLFRLPGVRIAALQEARGFRVTFPDQSSGRRPKPIGQIVREHIAGIGGEMPNLLGDAYSGEYDASDSREVIIQGLIGGGRGEIDGEAVIVDEGFARRLVADKIDDWPIEERWKTATAILIACCQGFVPPVKDEDPLPGNVEAATV